MTTILNFTRQSISAIPYSEKRQVFRDSKDRYLHLFVTKMNKTFYFYGKRNGRLYQFKIGKFPEKTPDEARTDIYSICRDLAAGKDPMEQKKLVKEAMTLKELFDLYKEDKKGKKRTVNIDFRNFNKYLETLHNLKLNDITYEKVKSLHSSMSGIPYMANRCLALLSSVFNYARKEYRLKIDNPCYGITKYPEHPKQRIMNKEELAKFIKTGHQWKELPEYHFYADIFLLLLYTGQRKANVTKMKFEDIDFVSHQWTIKPEEAKNKDYNIVPLVNEAFDIIDKRRKLLSKKAVYVFPSPTRKGQPIFDIEKKWIKFLEAAKIAPDLDMHDIRRTAGSLYLMNTGNLKAVQKFLGHKSIDTTSKVYTHIYSENMRDSLQDTFDKIKKK